MQSDEIGVSAGAAPNIHQFGDKLRHPRTIQAFRQFVAGMRHYRATGSAEKLVDVPLLSINLDLTTACDHACGHCVDDEVINTGPKYSGDNVLNTIDTLADRGLCSVILIGGGEPTLHPKFGEIVRHIKARGLELGLVTHGGHAHKIVEVADQFQPTDWVRFSIDAATNDTYQDIHFGQAGKKPRNTLAEILANGRSVREANPAIQLGYSYVVVPPGQEYHGRKLRDNIDEIPGAAANAREYGFTYLSLKPCLIKREVEGETLMYGVRADEIEAVNARIRAKIAAAQDLAGDVRIVQSQNLIAMLSGQLDVLREQPQVCYAGFLRQVVSPFSIVHCPAWRGDIRAQVGNKLGYADPQAAAATAESTAGNLLSFNATRTCADIACFYNSMNRYIDHVVGSDIPVEKIEPSAARDTFL
jgi:pyruvate-formate lyase-activating enzyme